MWDEKGTIRGGRKKKKPIKESEKIKLKLGASTIMESKEGVLNSQQGQVFLRYICIMCKFYVNIRVWPPLRNYLSINRLMFKF